MKYVVRTAENPKYSIIVPFTRLWCVEPFFNNLNKMILPTNSEIIFWVDTDEDELFTQVSRNAERLALPGVQVIWAKSGAHLNDDIKTCRERIINVHENLKSEIKGSIVIGLEDDTLPPPNAIKRLITHLRDPEVGFAQGIEVGRRGYRIHGAWQVTDDGISSLPKGEGIQDIDGGGFYCFATRVGLYKSHNFDPSDTPTALLGPDFNFVYGIKCKGYRCITDWDLPCTHLNMEDGKVVEITLANAHHIARYYKQGNDWRSKLTVI